MLFRWGNLGEATGLCYIFAMDYSIETRSVEGTARFPMLRRTDLLVADRAGTD